MTLLPIRIKRVLKQRVVLPGRLRRQYKHDYYKFIRGSFMIRPDLDQENLKGALTFHAHALEKGFVHDDFRPGFGTKAINNLIGYLNKFLNKNYSKNDLRFEIAIDTLNKYLQVHQKLGFVNTNTKRIKQWLKENHLYKESDIENGGYFIQDSSEVKKNIKGDFAEFSNSRHSVRNFDEMPIDERSIIDSIQLASNAPSVCNRQSYKVYRIHDKGLIQKLLQIQGGINGMATGISDLLVVSTNTKYFRSVDERNQPYIDGGIFSMNLLYALHYNNIATCPLNADLTLDKEQQVKKITGMSETECVILFVAVGNFKTTNKIPLSKRESYKDILIDVTR